MLITSLLFIFSNEKIPTYGCKHPKCILTETGFYSSYEELACLVSGFFTVGVIFYKFRQKSIIVIKNVPCLECDEGGEKYYTDEVAEKLEIIVNMAKILMQEIAVIDYKQAA